MINLIESAGFDWEMTNDIYRNYVKYNGLRYRTNITIKNGTAKIFIDGVRPYDDQDYVYAYIDIINGIITYYRVEGPINGDRRPVRKWRDIVSKLVPKFNEEFDTIMPNDADSVQTLLNELSAFDEYPDDAQFISDWLTEIEEFAIKRLEELNKDYKPMRAIW